MAKLFWAGAQALFTVANKQQDNSGVKSVIIDKIIRGDKGDNILPIILRKSKTNTDKLFRVSTKDVNENLNIHNDIEIKNYIDNIIYSNNYINRVVKKVGETYEPKTSDEILEHFKYNVKFP